MIALLAIQWDVDPTLFEIGPITIRWYGVLFASAFLAGYYLMTSFLKRENLDINWMDSLLVYMMLGTIIGARLGHVFFYQWDYYQDNLIEILMPWKGGLASHGAAIGIIVSMWLWSRKVSKKPILWILDRIVITVALAAVFIRTGNLINHEIVGAPTDVAWAFVFYGHPNFYQPDMIPRHPAQIYEALCYLVIFGILLFSYLKTSAGKRSGMLFGLFLILLFTARFFIEFIKEVQVGFEDDMTLKMGQILSIPLVLAGCFFVARALHRPADSK